MNADLLLPHLNKKLSKNKVVMLRRKIRKSDMPLEDLIKLSLSPDGSVAWRAAWILENVVVGKMTAYIHQIPVIITAFPVVKSDGAKRHYGKMMMKITDPKSAMLQNIMAKTDMENVVETCFDWLIDEKIKVAVKVFCIQILFNLHFRYDWIREELPVQIEHLMHDGSAGIQSKGRKILSALRKYQ